MSGMVTALYEALGPDEVLAPGVYAASSDSPAYGDLKALELLGEATYLGDGFSQDGRPAILVRIGGLQKNASGGDDWEFVAQPPNYYSRNKKNYADWRTAWWRECIQNSVDAGARRIVLDQRWLDEARQPCDSRFAKFVEVSCEDDGSGMDERVLRLFVGEAAASVKFGDDAAGGFGKAKEILLWAHVSYTVQSRDLVAFGEGNRFKIKRASDVGATPIKGTRVATVMAVGDCTLTEKAIATIQYSSLPKVTFVVSGTEMKARCAKGREVDTQIKLNGELAMRLYHTKERQDFDRPAILVRDRSGLFMFKVFAPSSFQGVLVVELVQKSVDLLTENRDGLKIELSDALTRFTNELAADTMSKLRPKKNLFRQAYRSIGKGEKDYRSVDANVAMSWALGSFDPEGREGIGFSEEQKETILQALKGQGFPATFAEQGLGDESAGDSGGAFSAVTVAGGAWGEMKVRFVEMDLRAPLDAIRAHLTAGVRDAKHAEQAIRLMASEPDFVISNEWEDWKPGAKFEPHLMSGKVLQLARFWKELVRWVLIQLGSSVSFNVGFGFDENFGAYCASSSQPGASHSIVLNPFKELSPTGPMYDLSNDDDVKSLFALAVHECVHAAAGCNVHDEAFASAFTRYVAKTAGQWDVIEKLRRAATSRGTAEQAKAARERKAAAAKADREARRPKTAKYDYVSVPSSYPGGRENYASVVKPGKPGEDTRLLWEDTNETGLAKDREIVVVKRYADVPIKYKVGDILRKGAVDYVVESVYREWAARDGHEWVSARKVRGGALWSLDGVYPIVGRVGPGGHPGPEKTREVWELEPGEQATWEIADFRHYFGKEADFVVQPPARFRIRRDEANGSYFAALPVLHVDPSAAVAYDRSRGEVELDMDALRAACTVRSLGTAARSAEFVAGQWVSVHQRANYLGASVDSDTVIRRTGLIADVVATPSGNWSYALVFPKNEMSAVGGTLTPIPYGWFFEFCVTPSEPRVMSLFSDSEKKVVETLREKGRSDLVDRMMQAVLKERLAWPETSK